MQNVLQAGDAAMQGSFERATLWIVGSIAVAPLAAWAERVKVREVK